MDEELVWTVRVEWAHERPPSPENTSASWVRVAAQTDTEAQLIAAQIAATHSVMPTATEIVGCEW